MAGCTIFRKANIYQVNFRRKLSTVNVSKVKGSFSHIWVVYNCHRRHWNSIPLARILFSVTAFGRELSCLATREVHRVLQPYVFQTGKLQRFAEDARIRPNFQQSTTAIQWWNGYETCAWISVSHVAYNVDFYDRWRARWAPFLLEHLKTGLKYKIMDIIIVNYQTFK